MQCNTQQVNFRPVLFPVSALSIRTLAQLGKFLTDGLRYVICRCLLDAPCYAAPARQVCERLRLRRTPWPTTQWPFHDPQFTPNSTAIKSPDSGAHGPAGRWTAWIR